MYGKIFEDIFDSSLSTDGDFITTYVFMSMIVLADEHGFVHLGAEALYERLRFPNDFVCGEAFRDAIRVLEQPDGSSNLPYEGGRRIVPLREIEEIEDNRGWWIVNYLHYRDKANQDERKNQRREYMRNYMTDRRKKEKENKGLEGCKQPVNTSKQKNPYTDTDTDTDINPTAWGEYVQHRKEKRQKMTPLSEVKQKNVLRQFSFDDQQKLVDITIANGWTGLFPDKVRYEARKQGFSFADIHGRNRKAAGLD